jgi:hypothetical protein
VHKRLEVDLALMTDADELLTALARSIVHRATPHEAKTFSRVRSTPGVGTILALVLLYASQESRRCPSVQDVAAYGRLVDCAKASAGTRDGPSGQKRGQAPLKGPVPKPPCGCCGTTRRGKKMWPAWSQHTTRGKPGPSWPTSWLGPSMTGCHAKRCWL